MAIDDARLPQRAIGGSTAVSSAVGAGGAVAAFGDVDGRTPLTRLPFASLAERAAGSAPSTPGRGTRALSEQECTPPSWTRPAWHSRWKTHRATLLAAKDEDLERAVKLACCHVLDAAEGRLDDGLASAFKSRSSWKYQCCVVQTHRLWRAMVAAACVLHCLLGLDLVWPSTVPHLLARPSPGSTLSTDLAASESMGGSGVGQVDLYAWEAAAEWIVLFTYAADIMMQTVSVGLRGSHVRAVLDVVLLFALAADAASVAPSPRLAKSLRPLAALLRFGGLFAPLAPARRLCAALLRACALCGFAVLVVALVLPRLLRAVGVGHGSLAMGSMAGLRQAILGNPRAGGGTSSPTALSSLLASFGVLLALGAVLAARAVAEPSEFACRRVREARAMMQAFHVLDARAEGKLRQPVFDRLLQSLRPRDPPLERRLKFSLLSNRCALEPAVGTRLEPSIDPLDFLYLRGVLGLKLEGGDACSHVSWRWSSAGQALLKHRWYSAVYRVTILADTCAFLADAEGLRWGMVPLNDAFQVAFLLHAVVRVLAMGGPRRFVHSCLGRATLAEPVLAFGLTLQLGLCRALSAGLLGGCNGGAPVDSAATCDAVFMSGPGLAPPAAAAAMASATALATPCADAAGSVAWDSCAALGALRCLRLAWESAALARLCHRAASMGPALARLFILLLVGIYFFAATAVWLLGDHIQGFSTMPAAAQALIQLLLRDDGASMVIHAACRANAAAAFLVTAYCGVASILALSLAAVLVTESAKFFGSDPALDAEGDDGERLAHLTEEVGTVLREMEVLSHLGVATPHEGNLAGLRRSLLRATCPAGAWEDEEILRLIQEDAPMVAPVQAGLLLEALRSRRTLVGRSSSSSPRRDRFSSASPSGAQHLVSSPMA